jgi:C1A family cysteine protease
LPHNRSSTHRQTDARNKKKAREKMKKAIVMVGLSIAASTTNGASAEKTTTPGGHLMRKNVVAKGKMTRPTSSSSSSSSSSSGGLSSAVASLSFGGGNKHHGEHSDAAAAMGSLNANGAMTTEKAPLMSSSGEDGVLKNAEGGVESGSSVNAQSGEEKQQQQQQQLPQQQPQQQEAVVHHKKNFVEFMKAHNKNYCPENEPTQIEKPCPESIKREKIFEANLLKMNQHNAKSGKAFGMRVTEFADLTQEEFIAKHLTYKSWKKEQMEIAANRAGRQPDDPKVEIPAEIEKSFEKSFGKLEKAAEDESDVSSKENEKKSASNDSNQLQTQNASRDDAVKQNSDNNNKNANNQKHINEAKEGRDKSSASSSSENEKSYDEVIGDMFAKIRNDEDDYSLSDDSELSSSTSLENDRPSLLGVDNYPEEFSWTNPPEGWPRDLVGEVHDQRDTCASCWAFVSADSIAARAAVMTKDDIVILSVKQLMNCDSRDHGCNTGNMYTAYMYVDESGGIASKAKYDAVLSDSGLPSTEEDQDEMKCMENVEKKWTTPGMCDIAQTEGNDALMKAIYEKGPIAIGINANNLQMYDEGVIKFEDCGPAGRGISSINHAALVVGWGIDRKYGDTPYWLVKNSYGTSFGENGYFKLERGPKGPVTLGENQYDENGFSTCGLLFESVYPVVKHADDDGGEELGSDETCTAGSYYKREYRRDPSKNPGAASTSSAALSSQLGEAIANGKSTITELDMIRMWDEQMRDNSSSEKDFSGVAPLAGAMAATLAVVAGIARKARKLSAVNEFVNKNASEDSPLLMNKAVVSTQ